MSLFKICNWWSVQCPDTSDNYDSSSLLCYRFGLNNDEKDYIIVGSHSGHLSIYYPNQNILDLEKHEQNDEFNKNQNENDNNENISEQQQQQQQQQQMREYKPTDLILEIKLKSPIIDLVAGKFSGDSKNDKCNQLAILHPLSLCVYAITKIDGVTEYGTHTTLQILIEHKFSRYAFSLCKGHFGKVKGREFLCINHVDGNLTFYEQDGINYECTLPGDKSIPSNLYYVPRTDSFIRMNSSWELECFSYQDLSQSAVLQMDIKPTWSICIGEFALDIVPVQVTNTRTSIMILGERNLICVTDEGKTQFILKLDYLPKCFHSFVVGWYWEPNARLITAIVTESSSLLIYDESKLIWTAQFDDNNTIISIKRSNLINLPGAIITLNTNGLINVGYLGSEPYIFKVPPLNLNELDYDKCHNELLEFEKIIKNSLLSNDNDDNNDKNLNINFNLDLINLKKCTFINDLSFELKNFIQNSNNIDNDDDVIKMCCGKFEFKTNNQLEQIQIYINLSDGIKCNKDLYTFNNLNVNHNEIIDDIWFYPSEKNHVYTTKVNVIVSFINKQNIPRILTTHSYLPLSMFCKLTSPQKNASIKITLTLNTNSNNNKNNDGIGVDIEKSLDTNRLHTLCAIFEEFGITDDNLQAIGFMMILTDIKVTVIAAKNTNRFRIQSDSVEPICLILEAIKNYVNRICGNENQNLEIETEFYNNDQNVNGKKHQKRQKEKQNKIIKKLIATPPYIPIQEIMKIVSEHHNTQEEIRNKSSLMNLLWNQFKLFQRSLRSKKDDDPIDGLMMLIEKNYDDLIIEGDQLMKIRENERKIRTSLSCAIALVNHLISCFENIESIERLLLSTFVFPVEDWTEQTWEECVAPVFDLLNHYGPLSRNKSVPLDNQTSISSTYFEFDRFKRHMTSVLERVCRITSDLKQNQHKQNQRKQIQQQYVAPSTESFCVSKNMNNYENTITTTAIVTSSVDDNGDDHDDVNNDDVGAVASVTTVNTRKELFNNEKIVADSVKSSASFSLPLVVENSSALSTEKFENEIENTKSSSENEFKNRSEIAIDVDDNNDDNDDDDEDNNNENDWLNSSDNIIPTAVEIIMLGQGVSTSATDKMLQ